MSSLAIGIVIFTLATFLGVELIGRVPLERGYYEELAAALNYAQKLAVASGCPVRVAITAAGYGARQQAPSSGRCNSADALWSTNVTLADRDLLAGVSPIGVAVAPSVTLVFDALGRTDLAANQVISVGPFSLTDRATGGYLGEVGLYQPAHYPEPELGWILMADAEGRGLAEEAARAVRAWAYASLGLETLVSYIARGNARSIRLAERLGAVAEPDAPSSAPDAGVWRHPGPEARG